MTIIFLKADLKFHINYLFLSTFFFLIIMRICVVFIFFCGCLQFHIVI